MSWARVYTDEQDAEINRRRLAGETWAAIAEALGRSRRSGECIRERARAASLPCVTTERPPPPPPREINPRELAGADPLPPGHPISWGAIALESRAP
jgi:hypothetical protein